MPLGVFLQPQGAAERCRSAQRGGVRSIGARPATELRVVNGPGHTIRKVGIFFEGQYSSGLSASETFASANSAKRGD